MIGRLRGTLLEVDGSLATVDAGGVGYEVHLPESVLMRLPAPGEQVDLRIRQVFREDGISLYGFIDGFQRRLFDLLTEVKGCGPKIGLSLIGQLGEGAVTDAIITNNPHTLAKASGVGPRLAERIILELKNKVAEETATHRIGVAVAQATSGKPDDELVETLMALGYRRQEAETAARETPIDADLQDRVKVALRSLAR